ncbi:hypothetical protein [Acidithiobacillus ferrivorans]|nr:hypothetical protein [Acidithiobacillus ferrivorans]
MKKMEESKDVGKKIFGQSVQAMNVPENFFYANSVRVYSGAGDCMLEFGRSLPAASPGDTPAAVPVIGLVVPALVAVHLAKQLLMQAALLAPQMVEMKDIIASELGDINVGTAS